MTRVRLSLKQGQPGTKSLSARYDKRLVASAVLQSVRENNERKAVPQHFSA